MTRFLCALLLCFATSSSHPNGPSYQIRTAVDSLQKFLVNSLNNATNTAATSPSETETDEVKLASYREAFFNLFDAVRQSTVVAMDKKVRGKQVCGRGELRFLKSTEGFMFRGSAKCQQFSHAIRCFEQVLTPKASNETMRIKHCCGGSESDDILTKGCKKSGPTPTLISVMAKYKCTGEVKDSKEMSTYILIENSSKVIEIPGEQHVHDWFHGSRLIDKKGASYIISQNSDNVERVRTYLNCLALDTTGLITSRGVAHVCKKNIKPAERTLGDLLEKKYSDFFKLLSKDLKQKLKSNSGLFFTVFAVSDKNLKKYDKKLLERVASKKNEFGKAHVFSKMSCSYTFGETSMTSLSEEEISVQTVDGSLTINKAKLSATVDIVATNGVIHEIEKIIDEEEYQLWTERCKDYNPDFVKAVSKDFDAEKGMTIFMPPKTEKVDKDDIAHHVILNSCESFAFETIITVKGKSKYFFGRFPQHIPLWNASLYGEEPFGALKWFQIGCTRISPVSLKAFNSNVYFIEKPLKAMKQTVVEFLSCRSELSKFTKLFKSFLKEFKGSLSGYTLVIPTNEAFDKKSVKDVDAFVLGHMLLEPICEHDLLDGQEAEYLSYSQEKIHLKNKGGTIFIHGVAITERFELSDAVVYVNKISLKPIE